MYTFRGKWICPAKFAEIKPKNVFHRQLSPIEIKQELPENQHIFFKKKFFFNGRTAKIMISADDYYKLYINGSFVTSGPCAGFDFNYYYNEMDITDFL